MKVAILAGGTGARLAEETDQRPKPLVEIGGAPILWHIMKLYSHFGFDDFVLALGHKAELIRRRVPEMVRGKPWRVQLVDTGLDTRTGGRVKRLAPYLGGETFFLTWSDGLADVDVGALLAFHRRHGRLATVTAVHPPSRFGRLVLDGDRVVEFREKPVSPEWINGAFFVLEPAVLEYIDGDSTRWEHEPLERLAAEGQLMAYRHESFWQCMDTVHDRRLLEELWSSDAAPWKVWE